MSRAFVKESDGDEPFDELPPRPARVQPCYMTASGVAALKREFDLLAATSRGDDNELELGAKAEFKRQKLRRREIARLLNEVVPVDLTQQPTADIRFGATVMLRDEHGKSHRFQVVGEDEVAPAAGRISWVSPLGRELLGRRLGDVVIWQRPAGDIELEVIGFDYLDGSGPT